MRSAEHMMPLNILLACRFRCSLTRGATLRAATSTLTASCGLRSSTWLPWASK